MILKLIAGPPRYTGLFEAFDPYYSAILSGRPEYRVSINEVLRMT
jgi:hypothetical protein